MNLLYLVLLIFTFISLSKAVKKGSILDLSYTYNNDTPMFPLHIKFKSEVAMDGLGADPQRGFDGFYSNDFTMSEHAGTHVDAPKHVGKNLQTIDKVSLDKLYKIPGITIDVSSQAKSNPNYGVQIKDIEDWIEQHGDIPDGSIIIFTTGWGEKAMAKEDSYTGADTNGTLNHPGISAEAAQWIVDYKNTSDSLVQGIIAIAIDTVSLDIGNLGSYPAHEILLPAGILGIENAANTNKLPPKDFTITMLPLKIEGGTGSPIRLMAEINAAPSMIASSSSAQILMLLMSLCAFVLV